jgi:hypothetical protein
VIFRDFLAAAEARSHPESTPAAGADEARR